MQQDRPDYWTVSSRGAYPAAETTTLSLAARPVIVHTWPGSMACSGRFRDFESAWKYTLSRIFAVTLSAPSEVFFRLSTNGPVSASAFAKVAAKGRLGALSSR